jgi:hypothetical protein
LARVHFDQGELPQAVQLWGEIFQQQKLEPPGPGWLGLLPAILAWWRASNPGWEDQRLVRDPKVIPILVEACQGIIKAEYWRSDPRRRNLLLYVTMVMRQLAYKTGRDDLLANSHSLFVALYALHIPAPARQIRHHTKALLHARRCNDPRVLTETLWITGFLSSFRGDLKEGRDLLLEAVETGRRCHDLPGLCYAHNLLSVNAAWNGDPQTMEDSLKEAVPLARGIRHPRLILGLDNMRMWHQILLGRWTAAAGFADLANPPDSVSIDSAVLTMLQGIIAFRQGHLHAAQALSKEACEEFLRLRSGILWALQAAFWQAQALAHLLRRHPESSGTPERQRELRSLAARTRRWAGSQGHLRAHALAIGAAGTGSTPAYDQASELALKYDFRPLAAWILEFSARGTKDWRERLERAARLASPGEAERLRALRY